LKIGVQVNTTGFKSTSWPLVHVVSDPGNTIPPTQPEGLGSGVFYFDENTQLEIASLRNNPVTGNSALKGWFNGDGAVFANTGAAANLTPFSLGTNSYLSKHVTALTRPGRVMWD